MASTARQTTVTPSVMISKCATFVLMYTLTVHGVAGQCQLPDRLRGRWKEPLKGTLTFTNDSVSGYDIHTFGEFTLSCLLQNSSALYIMESTPFSYFGLNFTAYTCWSFDEQSKDLVHLYEHTEENQQAGYERVKMYMPLTNWTVDSVCSNTSTLTYRLLHKQRRKSGNGSKSGETGVVVAIVVLVVVATLVAIVSFLLIRRRKSHGMFKINAKTGSRNKASAYRVHEPEESHTSPSSSSFKNTTTTTIAASGQEESCRPPNNNITQVGKPCPEDNTSEDAYSPSSVSVTATSAFTSVSASSSSSASSSVFASGSGLMNQEGANPMTPICGSEDREDKQSYGFSDQFVPVNFSSAQGLAAEEGAVSASGTGPDS